ncbi:hypothetical protein ACTUM0_08195 [Schaalia turicensis]|uniref:hypothetical protein n=1 Tax=Schaalia turicensis TaxID=131111 RepID=UPI003FA41272
MSAEAVQWAFGLTDGIDVLEKMVLLSLADDAGEDGWVLFRSIERLARRSRSSVDDVKGALVHLQQRGLIDLGGPIEAKRFPMLGQVKVGSDGL